MKQTPLMQQYCDLKEEYDDCILFFRVGDFYEMFFEDAKNASNCLNITLTSYAKNEKIPMCGVPYHASDAYINKLIGNGYKIALCEQTESPFDKIDKKGPLKREVVRVITPGTVTESSMLDPKSYNFLMCCSPVKTGGMIGYAIVDLSVGDFFVEEMQISHLKNVLSKWNPTECLMADSIMNQEETWKEIVEWHKKIQLIPNAKYNLSQSKENLKALYKVSTLGCFGNISDSMILASGFLSQYLMYTQKNSDIELKPMTKIDDNYLVHLDKFTRDNLEIVKTIQGSNKGTLFDSLDCTTTAVGARLFKFRLMSPIKKLDLIKQRLDAVEFFVSNDFVIKKIKQYLLLCHDLERALGRVILNRSIHLDLISISNSLDAAQNIYNVLFEMELPYEIKNILDDLGHNSHIIKKIDQAIINNPSIKMSDGGFIRSGYDSKLDELRNMQENCELQLQSIQEKYKEELKIPTLRIKYNNILGYFVEIPKNQKGKISYNFIEKQSLANVCRYTNELLNNISDQMNESKDMVIQYEMNIFNQINEFVKSMKNVITCASRSIAIIDVNISLATVAISNNYCKPNVDDKSDLYIKNGRNPIIETILCAQQENFTPNDCDLNEKKCILMTGPNMAGKSTYLRQNALIVLMAQIGSYVPADYMNFSIVDGIFVRIGASDNLAKGMSTFMVEMVEVACILNNATENSLIIIDEVGRGTSTKEGQAIAFSIMEYISNKRIRSLFSTHYHELVEMSTNDNNIGCATMEIKESDGKLIFLHKMKEGSTDKSYALSVCKMAGIPQNIIDRSSEIIESFD